MSTRPTESDLEGAWILRFLMPKLTIESSWPLKILHVTPEGDETEIGKATVGLKEGDLVDFVRDEIAKGHSRLVLDLEAVEVMDSAGIGEVVASSNCAYDIGGEVVVAGLPPAIEKLINSATIGWWWSPYPSVSEALQHFKSGSKIS